MVLLAPVNRHTPVTVLNVHPIGDRRMGELKPWHLAVVVVCCLLPFAVAVAGTIIWAIGRRQPK